MTTPDPTPAPVPPPADPDTGPSGGRPGYLYRKVALYLVEHPDEILKPGEITRALDVPSSGAVFEVLKKMAATGHAISAMRTRSESASSCGCEWTKL